ncbi:hypothetical protein [Fodinicurvata sp. EGI_FJ10296]|jgi:hypothetical protein|uniref:hypothetical protein n=1 Tax=Fodinicurvata sp. EGI_FJ10296 TaxID=3231908 RepID=UPI003453BB63
MIRQPEPDARTATLKTAGLTPEEDKAEEESLTAPFVSMKVIMPAKNEAVPQEAYY